MGLQSVYLKLCWPVKKGIMKPVYVKMRNITWHLFTL